MQPEDKKSQISYESANSLVTNGIHSDNSFSEDMSASEVKDHSSSSTDTSNESFTEHVYSENFETDPACHNVDHYEKDPKQVELDNMWQQLEGAMIQSHDEIREKLTEYGVGDGDEDSESEEGQIWRMVQGDSPYMLELT